MLVNGVLIAMNSVEILNILIDNLTSSELLTRLQQQGGIVFTPNVDHLVNLQKDREFYQAYQTATYRVCDSKIVQYASQFLGHPLQEKISGSDLFPAFYKFCKTDSSVKIFLLGASSEVAKKAQTKINKKVQTEIVVATYSPSFGFETDPIECQKIVQLINQSEATVLVVGLGSPKQEKWITQYQAQLTNIKVFLAVGASIDFEAGYKPRAPQWMREVGLEWFYRLQSEPRRLWKRYLVDSLPFLALILQQKLGLYQCPFSTIASHQLSLPTVAGQTRNDGCLAG